MCFEFTLIQYDASRKQFWRSDFQIHHYFFGNIKGGLLAKKVLPVSKIFGWVLMSTTLWCPRGGHANFSAKAGLKNQNIEISIIH